MAKAWGTWNIIYFTLTNIQAYKLSPLLFQYSSINPSPPSATYVHQWIRSVLVQTNRRQALIKTNTGLLSIGPLGTNFSETFIKIQIFSFTKMHLTKLSEKWWPFCPWGDKLTVVNCCIPSGTDTFNNLPQSEILMFNTLRPRQNGRHFTDNIFNRIFVNENVRISIEFSLKFVPKGPINNIPALV